ncbi:MAG TPA: response regulator transcription factor, partial [Gammaproteobacteria bacterium]|nr:response regulator transcription factor [Gammaproteobacteria bacterium]
MAVTKRIAILEDDPAQLALLQSWLNEAGYYYQLFQDGASLLRA